MRASPLEFIESYGTNIELPYIKVTNRHRNSNDSIWPDSILQPPAGRPCSVKTGLQVQIKSLTIWLSAMEMELSAELSEKLSSAEDSSGVFESWVRADSWAPGTSYIPR